MGSEGVGRRADADAAGESAPWTGLDRALFAALVLGMLASLPALIHPWYDPRNDAAIYLLCTKSLLNGEGYAFLGEPYTVRPPGLSILLAPLVAWRGLDFHALNLFVGLTGAAAAVCVFLLLRPRVGSWVATAAAAVLHLNPAFRELSSEVMSDVPGLALALGCLLVERWSRRGSSMARECALGVCIGLSMYVRSAAVLLVPSILVARVLEHVQHRDGVPTWIAFLKLRVLAVALVPALLIAPWSLRNAACAPREAVDQQLVHSYSTAMWRRDPGDPASPRVPLAEILARVPERGRQVFSLLGTRMRTSSGGTLDVALGGVMFALAVTLGAMRRRSSDLLLVSTTALVLIYFAFGDRLALPIFVLTLMALAELARLVLARFLRTPRASLVATALLAALALADFRPRSAWKEIEASDRAWRETSAEVRARLPDDARVASAVGWHLSLFLDRPVWSLRFAMLRSGKMRDAEAILDKYRLNTVVAVDFDEDDRPALNWFRKNYPGEQAGQATILRVRP